MGMCSDIPLRFIHEQASLCDYVSLAIEVGHIEEKFTGDREPFLELGGIDIEGADCGKLRMWQYDMSDVRDALGKVFILRGMRVQYERLWDYWERRYFIPSSQNKVPTCCRLTALEDVSGTVIEHAFKRRRDRLGGS